MSKQEEKSLPEKVIDEIKKNEHPTAAAAIDAVDADYPVQTDDIYFTAFDINNDFNGKSFQNIKKIRISHTSELGFQGKIAAEVERLSLTENHIVFFFNKDRAIELARRVIQFEGLDSVVQKNGGEICKAVFVAEERDQAAGNPEDAVTGKYLRDKRDTLQSLHGVTENVEEALQFEHREEAKKYLEKHNLSKAFLITEL